MYYSEEQYYEASQEALGDGYSNEYQRCYAQSCAQTVVPNERDEAFRLHSQGLIVVCAQREVCCRVTDALIGYAFIVIGSYTSRTVAEICVKEYSDAFIFEPAPPAPAPLSQPINEDDIPF
jgi:hypothetical protein